MPSVEYLPGSDSAGQAKQCHTSCDIAACQGGGTPSLEPPRGCDATIMRNPVRRKKTHAYKTEAKVYISLRTTNAVKTRITKQATLLNISESEYTRRAVLSALTKGDKLFRNYSGPKVIVYDEKLRQELNRIGVNINQIAYALNAANVNRNTVNLADIYAQLSNIITDIDAIKNNAEEGIKNVL